MADNRFRLYSASVILLLGIISSSFNLQGIAAENLSNQKLTSRILQNEIVKKVNENPDAGWKAAYNDRFANATVAEFKRLMGAKLTPKKEYLGVPVVSHDRSLKLPKEFDARTAWSQCTSIARILGQFLISLLLLSLVTVALAGHLNISLSVNDLLACCGFLCGQGCNGGYPISAWRYFKHHGVVTEECDPYFDQTGCSHPGCEPAYPTPKCVRKCVSGNQLWRESKHFGVSAYKIKSDPHDIMAEVYKNGPVEVAFTVYEDFAHYKSGVYKHITGDNIGGHAVKLIGWGTSDDGEDYWLLANQWNRSWGDDGYFKIKRGTNECGIEHGVVAGLPSDRNVFKGITTTSDDLLVSSF
ncbi:unnamed protein product [Thlaspi arvense]|uniref:Peptidase C1A papain C-terminal domain-containing protein n=1 Tax=Thlaspi arvense TaxID=13288 RepID=A0AAU9RJQ5_THLAR|nr:unnamed protein product [Thlaspi arvense]